MATDKQVWFLKNKGIDASQMSFEQASAQISALKAQPQAPKPQFQAFQPKTEFKKPFDTSSYYVAYAKDLVVAMMSIKKNENIELDILMEAAVNAIKKAQEAFK